MDSTRFVRIWKMPLIILALSVFGLLAALLGLGVWHWLAWAALYIPVVILVRFLAK